jgi:hypothetical protein
MQVEIDYLDDQITVAEDEPTTLGDLVALYGEEAVRSYAADNWRYRNKHPRVYKKASAELAEKFPRAVKEEKTLADGTKKKIYDSEINHLRECYKQDPELTTTVITKHAQAEPLFVKGERVGGGKIGQAAMDAANGLFAEGDDAVENAVNVMEATVPGLKVGRDADNAVTPESLARGIQTLNKYLVKQQTAKTMAMLEGRTGE